MIAPGPTERVDLETCDDLAERLHEWFNRHGDIVRVETPQGEVAYVTAAADDAQRVLVANHRNYRKGLGIDRIELLLGKGLMVAEGERWTRHRVVVAPMLHARAVAAMREAFVRRAREVRDAWLDAIAHGRPIDVSTATSEFALATVLDALFGAERTASVTESFSMVAAETRRDLAFAREFRRLRGVVREVIARRRSLQRLPDDLLSGMISARDAEGAGLADDEIVDEVLTLVVAGHETTASALAWVWLLLGEYPEAERTLHHELDRREPGAPEPAYALQVVQEALRLHPPGWLVTRRAVEPDVLSGVTIESGAHVLLPLLLLHRHPAHWSEPDAFRPERFAATAPPRHPCCYRPFGAGPRRCVGEMFALREMTCHLVEIASALTLRCRARGPLAIEARVNLRMRDHAIMEGSARTHA